MTKNQILAAVLTTPADDIPEIVAAAINQWTAEGRGVTDLLERVSYQLGTLDDEELHDEFLMALEDWQ
ncbi:MAG: hypothetical protein E5V72_01480 [Mesorhizobium sp.]|uniref:hypothetical protein n=1 Tax=Mesorhizobium sp. TaxID=1871066 RepID=UPI000FE400D5|nr:hypothetical protein [Mesorhizobium sp.]RWH50264.1 MAG: hypothetical protein EOQ80_04645 [Mesorhizobium sp.]RWH52270.1 MAG: hypothetical protein EOQ82_26600 [Mesorhizobium sp.]RWI47576.1 MAG: hypothetical protein EOR15_13940 [Mesorhizobium sp.]RWI69697.1 MAG: hypothetical protein EOR18_20935 [Mesorhizobium sp.]RWI76164.1 MAG: hypothetical protein EOR19_18525 [Mesorhizobium sp.]